METKPFTLTARSVFIVLGILGGIWFLFAIRDILVILFLSVILASALGPLVDFLEKKNAPRWFAILSVYAILFSLLGVLLMGVVPILYLQFEQFIASLPQLFRDAVETLGLTDYVGQIEIKAVLPDIFKTFSTQLIGTPVSILRFAAGVFGGILDVFTFIVFSYYLLLEKEQVREQVSVFVPEKSRERFLILVDKGEKKLGAWLRGQLVLMFIIGVFSWVGLSLIGVEFAVSLAIIAGLLEIVPIVGPLVATVPAVMVALTQSPIHALAVIAMYIFLQQLEQSIVVPRVMKSAVGLDPLTVILAIMVGSRIAGTPGALLAIPVTVILRIMWNEYKHSVVYPTSKE